MDKFECSVVFCLAGAGKRFTDHGVLTPKYLLEVNQKYLIQQSITSLKIQNNHFVLFVCNTKHYKYKELLSNICENLKLKFKIIYVNSTNGQAESAFIASKFLIQEKNLQKKPVIFFNGDTILKSRNISELVNNLSNYDGLIDIFESDDPSFSYVSIKNGLVSDIIEKKVISNNATSGLYIFSSPQFYFKEYSEGCFDSKEDEIYISDIYAYIIKKGMLIKCFKSFKKSETIILGTLDQYNSFKEQNEF